MNVVICFGHYGFTSDSTTMTSVLTWATEHKAGKRTVMFPLSMTIDGPPLNFPGAIHAMAEMAKTASSLAPIFL